VAQTHTPIGGGSMPSRGGGMALVAFVLVALPSMTAPAPSSLLVSLDFVPSLGSLRASALRSSLLGLVIQPSAGSHQAICRGLDVARTRTCPATGVFTALQMRVYSAAARRATLDPAGLKETCGRQADGATNTALNSATPGRASSDGASDETSTARRIYIFAPRDDSQAPVGSSGSSGSSDNNPRVVKIDGTAPLKGGSSNSGGSSTAFSSQESGENGQATEDQRIAKSSKLRKPVLRPVDIENAQEPANRGVGAKRAPRVKRPPVRKRTSGIGEGGGQGGSASLSVGAIARGISRIGSAASSVAPLKDGRRSAGWQSTSPCNAGFSTNPEQGGSNSETQRGDEAWATGDASRREVPHTLDGRVRKFWEASNERRQAIMQARAERWKVLDARSARSSFDTSAVILASCSPFSPHSPPLRAPSASSDYAQRIPLEPPLFQWGGEEPAWLRKCVGWDTASKNESSYESVPEQILVKMAQVRVLFSLCWR